MSDKLVDMHIHTTMSDGSLTPQECIMHAAQNGISAVAITDHNSFAGVEDALYYGKKFGVEIIPAVEFNANMKGCFHFLAYFQNMNFIKLQSWILNFRYGLGENEYTQEKAILKMKENGGMVFLAHPDKYNCDIKKLTDWIMRFKKVGLDGIEVWHTDITLQQSEIYLRLAQELGLMVSGGSDFHGPGRPDAKMGKACEGMNIDYAICQKIK